MSKVGALFKAAQGSVDSDFFNVDAVSGQQVLGVQLLELGTGQLSEAPFVGNHDFLTSGEFHLASSEGF